MTIDLSGTQAAPRALMCPFRSLPQVVPSTLGNSVEVKCVEVPCITNCALYDPTGGGTGAAGCSVKTGLQGLLVLLTSAAKAPPPVRK